jgi:hypothetical protein
MERPLHVSICSPLVQGDDLAVDDSFIGMAASA